MRQRFLEGTLGVASQYRDVRALVLGATGFIGRWVAGALAAGGAEIAAVARDLGAARASGILPPGCRLVQADLEDPDQVRRLLDEQRPAIVFNLAGYGVAPEEREPDHSFRMNERLVAIVCEALRERPHPTWRGVRIVHTGSALEYGEVGGDLAEETEPRPTTLYGRSKLAGTMALSAACRRSGMRGLVARLFSVYGPGEPAGRLLPTLLSAAGADRAIDLTDGRQLRDFTYVEDVAEGLLRLGVCPAEPGAVVNLATGKLTSVREFVQIAAGVLAIAPERLNFGVLPTRTEEMRHEPVSIGALAGATAWRPTTTVAEGVARTAAPAPPG